MKKLSNKIGAFVVTIFLLITVGAFAFSFSLYWLTIGCFLFSSFPTYKLYRLNLKIVSQFKLFTDSIKILGNNISFQNDISDNEYISYYDSLSLAINQINRQTLKQEADINFYNNLLNRVDFALIVVDSNESIIWVNKFALDLLGRPKPRILDDIKKLSDELKKAFEEIQPRSSKILKLNNDEKVRKVILTLSNIIIKGDELRVYSLKDVQPVVDETEGIAWQQLISVLTHEIMNSLAPIISLSETFSKDNNDPELTNKAIQTIHRRSKGLIAFVSNYKRLTQIPKPEKTEVKIKPLVEDVINLMKGQYIEPHVLFTSDDLIAYIDRGQIEQVLINLLKNAWEACINTIEPVIRLTVSNNTSGQITISITDNGSGMEPDIIEKIFTPFYTTKPMGSGIGLSICRQIIIMHGGTLTLRSEPDKGSIFTIRI